MPLILFQYPDATKATYNLECQLEIAAEPGVFAMKNGLRNMRRWDTEIPVIRREHPGLQILTCHDEYLLHIVFDIEPLHSSMASSCEESLQRFGYVGQLLGAVLFGSLAEKIGRLGTLFITIVLFASMDIAWLFAWSGASLMALRFLQGVGTGGERLHQ